jgi:hypothetical protein
MREKMIQKTLEGNDLVIGVIFKVLRIDEDKFLSFFDHGKEWTLEYLLGGWTYAPYNSLIYCFSNSRDAEHWGERMGVKGEDYELWEVLGEKLIFSPPMVAGKRNSSYYDLWRKQIEPTEVAHSPTKTVGAGRIKLKRHIADIDVMDPDDDC